MEIYFDNRDELRTSNRGMEYGKVVADALEHGIQTNDLLTDSAILLLPKYDIADQEIRTLLSTKDGDITVLAKPDTRDSKTHDFREYKTGKTSWTKEKAQKHPQMIFYAMAIYLEFKKVLSEAYLDWIETEQTENGIQPTGRVESFRVTFTLADILKEMKETTRICKEIELAFATHVPDERLKY